MRTAASSSLESFDDTELMASNAALVGTKTVTSDNDLSTGCSPVATSAVLIAVYPFLSDVTAPVSGRVRTLSITWTTPPANLTS